MQKNKNVRTTSLKSIAAVLRARGKIQGQKIITEIMIKKELKIVYIIFFFKSIKINLFLLNSIDLIGFSLPSTSLNQASLHASL